HGPCRILSTSISTMHKGCRWYCAPTPVPCKCAMHGCIRPPLRLLRRAALLGSIATPPTRPCFIRLKVCGLPAIFHLLILKGFTLTFYGRFSRRMIWMFAFVPHFSPLPSHRQKSICALPVAPTKGIG